MSRPVNPWKVTGYKAGQNVVCKVSHAEPGGYAVIIPKDNLPGFLPTETTLKPGEEVLAQYVCVSNSRILLQCRFGTNTKPGAVKHQTVNWEEQLDQIDSRSSEKIDYHRPSAHPAAAVPLDQQVSSYAHEYDQEPASDQTSYAQESYASGHYAQNYAEAQAESNSPQEGQFAGPGQEYSYANPDPASHQQVPSQQYQYGVPSGSHHSAPGGVNNQAGAPAFQGPGQSDYDQNQSMQFSPSGSQPPSQESSSLAAAQETDNQFAPHLPADYVEVQNQWKSNANLTTTSPPAFSADSPPQQLSQPPQNQYQAPGQASPPYSGAPPQPSSPAAAPPSTYQASGPWPATSQQAPAVSGSYLVSPQSGQYDSVPSAPNQQISPSQAGSSGTYQSPGSYRGPSQIAAGSQIPAPFEEEESADAWGYAGQGWDDGLRLTPAASAAPVAPVIPSIPVVPPTSSPVSEADAAFQVWAPRQPTREFHLKRATDLVPPAFDSGSLANFTCEELDLEWLITDIEGGMRTGCVKAVCESVMSRSAALLYKGRAVGCIYGRKNQSENYGTEQSLQIMMQDLQKSDTQVQLYDLPDNVVLPMSALFLGYPVPREENVDARTYMDYMCNWFASKVQTACLAITFPSRSATCLCFIHEGKFCGAFYVEEQKLSEDKEFVYALMQSDSAASVETSILPPEMTSSAVRFGFNLSMARKKDSSRLLHQVEPGRYL